MAFTFVLFGLHEFSNITQILKVVLQYMDVHRLPVTHFRSDKLVKHQRMAQTH